MLERIQPRWLVIAAGIAAIAGVIGLYLGYINWSPMLLLAAELLTILAAILFTTPESAVRAAQVARQAEQRDAVGGASPAVDHGEAEPADSTAAEPTPDHDQS